MVCYLYGLSTLLGKRPFVPISNPVSFKCPYFNQRILWGPYDPELCLLVIYNTVMCYAVETDDRLHHSITFKFVCDTYGSYFALLSVLRERASLVCVGNGHSSFSPPLLFLLQLTHKL